MAIGFGYSFGYAFGNSLEEKIINTFAELNKAPSSSKVTLIEINVGEHLTQTWIQHGTYTSTYYATYFYENITLLDSSISKISKKVISIKNNGTALSVQTSIVNVNTNTNSYWHDTANKLLYVNISSGDPVNALTLIVYFNLNFSNNGININNNYYRPYIKSIPTITQTLDQLFIGKSTLDGGTVELNNGNGFFDIILKKFIWEHQELNILYGGESLPYNEYLTVYPGLVLNKIWTRDYVSLEIEHKKNKLKNIPFNKFTLDTFPSMDTTLEGTPIPLAYNEFTLEQGLKAFAIHESVTSNNVKYKLVDHRIKSIDNIEVDYNDGNSWQALTQKTVDDRLWLTDNTKNWVYETNTDGTSIISSFATSPGLLIPTGISYDPYGYLWLTDNTNIVFKMTTLGTVISTFSMTTLDSFVSLRDISYDEISDSLWVVDRGQDKIDNVTTDGTSVINSFLTTDVSSLINAVRGLYHDANTDSLWLADVNTNKIYNCTTNGNSIISNFSDTLLGTINFANGITMDLDGNLRICCDVTAGDPNIFYCTTDGTSVISSFYSGDLTSTSDTILGLTTSKALTASNTWKVTSLVDATFIVRFPASAYNSGVRIRAAIKGKVTSANSLIDNTADIVENLITSYTDYTTADLDTAEFATTKSKSTAIVGVYIFENEPMLDVIDKIGNSELAYFDSNPNGKFRYKLWDFLLPASIVTLKQTDLINLTVNTHRVHFTRMKIAYGYIPWDNKYLFYANTNTDEESIYGTHEEKVVDTYLTTNQNAKNIGDSLLVTYRKPVLTISGNVKRLLMDIYVGDKIAFTLDRAPDETLGSYTSKYFELRYLSKSFGPNYGATFEMDNISRLLSGFWTSDSIPVYTSASAAERSQSGFWSNDTGDVVPGDPTTRNISLWTN